jgi:serine/threonine protein kinase
MFSFRQIVGRAGCATHYTIGASLGQGGFGQVHLAENSRNHTVVIKCLSIKAIRHWKHLCTSIPREVFILAQLQSITGVVRIVDYFAQGPNFFICFEHQDYIIDLIEFANNCRKVPEAYVKKLFSQLVSIVAEIHSRGYFHGDLKLDNILLNRSTFQIVICDFGSSNALEQGTEVYFAGTPEYAPPQYFTSTPYAPEHYEVWSLGVVAYSLLEGCLPFDSPPKIKAAQLEWSPRLLKDLSPEMKDIVARCLDPCEKTRITLRELRIHNWLFP